MLPVEQLESRTLFSALPADFNRDGVVNFADLLIVAQHYGRPDGNGHITDFSYVLLVSQEYGQHDLAPPLSSRLPADAATCVAAPSDPQLAPATPSPVLSRR
jgi:hypothetical protein